jgi:hypothetical protein
VEAETKFVNEFMTHFGTELVSCREIGGSRWAELWCSKMAAACLPATSSIAVDG